MKRHFDSLIINCTKFAVLAFAAFSIRNAAAVQITLTLEPFSSHILQTGDFGSLPMLPQDGLSGTVDFNPAFASGHTTFQGTITLDVDSLVAPTSIRILASAADADVSGQWLPEVEPFLDVDGDLNFGEIGDDSVTTTGDNPAPATAADWGIRILHPSFGVNLAYGASRDVVYNVAMPAAVAVNGLGEFSSATEIFEFTTGWFDYWVAPAAGDLRGRTQLADDDNDSVLPSTIVVTPLGGGLTQYTLTIPIDINTLGDDMNFFYDGVFVATTIIPEPAALSLALVGISAILFRARKR